jgi:hypothetical protein
MQKTGYSKTNEKTCRLKGLVSQDEKEKALWLFHPLNFKIMLSSQKAIVFIE